MLKYRYIVESWRFEANIGKDSLEKAEDLVEGVWNTYSDVMEEWGIGEIEGSLETFTPKAEDVEQVRASSEAKITNWLVLDTKAMEFSVVSLAKLIAWVEEEARLVKKGITEITSLTVKGRLRAQFAEGPKASELAELSDKWTNSEQTSGKGSRSLKE